MADRVDATGILLVGGASSRFGSPKALARFRGEPLAERGHRILGEVCQEVIAVGKAADGLGLPFEIVDDGSTERAPVYGVLAGLRAATCERCLVLPVDCPRMNAAALRALLDAGAVPQTGPLPGAYAKAHVPELEARVARGELSLRGVNTTVLELEEPLLSNVNTPMELIAAAIGEWAEEREDVKAAVLVGSQARANLPADRWSDLDVILIVDDPAPYVEDETWVEEFGRPLLTFLEPTGFGLERRVLYETGEDVDLPLVPVSALDGMDASPDAADLIARGYRLLADKIGLDERLQRLASSARAPSPPTARDFRELAADFWYHALWTAKKLRRGEVFVAKECLDAYLKRRVVTLLEWHALSIDPAVEPWHAGRFLERWADPGALTALEDAYARYDVRDVARALWATVDLWQGLEEETGSRLGLSSGLDHAELRRRVAEVVPDPRSTSRYA